MKTMEMSGGAKFPLLPTKFRVKSQSALTEVKG